MRGLDPRTPGSQPDPQADASPSGLVCTRVLHVCAFGKCFRSAPRVPGLEKAATCPLEEMRMLDVLCLWRLSPVTSTLMSHYCAPRQGSFDRPACEDRQGRCRGRRLPPLPAGHPSPGSGVCGGRLPAGALRLRPGAPQYLTGRSHLAGQGLCASLSASGPPSPAQPPKTLHCPRLLFPLPSMLFPPLGSLGRHRACASAPPPAHAWGPERLEGALDGGDGPLVPQSSEA